jgi:maltose alpha-D-glucosyltransferase/alpha-amylase
MTSLLLSLPGTPVLYYGDEIGMGDNIYLGDRNGVRTPMQWSSDRNAGFSRSNPQQLFLPTIIDPEYHYEAINVEAQQNNAHSQLWWMKRILGIRKRFRAFCRGEIEFLHPENRKVLVFLRRFESEQVLVVVNLSRFAQAAEIDLAEFAEMVPVEVFGQTPFPTIGHEPYFLTLGPHAFYWFTLQPSEEQAAAVAVAPQLPSLNVKGGWVEILQGKNGSQVERVLPGHLKGRRWFASKARKILSTRIIESLPVRAGGLDTLICLVEVEFTEGDPDVYQIPLTFSSGVRASQVLELNPHVVVARLTVTGEEGDIEGILYDAVVEDAFCGGLLDIIAARRQRSGRAGRLRGQRTRRFAKVYGAVEGELKSAPLGAEQSNTSLVYGDRLILKLFRRLYRGVNPELEVGQFLTERTSFSNTPLVAGALAYEPRKGEKVTLAILQELVVNEGDAWEFTLDALQRYFERVLANPVDTGELSVASESPLACLDEEIPESVEDAIGGFLEFARLLGQRTAELHVALSSRGDEPDFAPEPITAMYRRSIYQSSRTRADQAFELLRKRLSRLPAEIRGEARSVLNMSNRIDQRLRSVVDRKAGGKRIRCHGDYHLGQVLFTGKDFVIMDFEGEPARPISERRLKRTPLRDVGGMLRSFHFASVSALIAGPVRPEDIPTLEPWAHTWYRWVVVDFLKGYLEGVSGAGILPEDRSQLGALLDLCVLDKALYELMYELNNRPDWVLIPLRGIASIIAEGAPA